LLWAQEALPADLCPSVKRAAPGFVPDSAGINFR
jgi:hypothetical protein